MSRRPVAAKRQEPERVKAGADYLKLLRRNYRLTQARAAAIIGVTHNTWSRWERGFYVVDQLKLEGITARLREWIQRRKAEEIKAAGPRPRRVKVRRKAVKP